MHPNAALIERFYQAFNARDAEAMAKCYHQDVIFSDPVFGELRGKRAGDMWRMLTARAKDLAVAVTHVKADDMKGSATWVANYRYGKDERPVRNVIRARFQFHDGLIIRHEDSFDLWKWSRMALGTTGTALGWTPLVRRKIRAEAKKGLDAYVARAR